MPSPPPVYWCFHSKLAEMFWNVCYFFALECLLHLFCRKDEDSTTWAQCHRPQMSSYHSFHTCIWTEKFLHNSQVKNPRVSFTSTPSSVQCLGHLCTVVANIWTWTDRYGPREQVGFGWAFWQNLAFSYLTERNIWEKTCCLLLLSTFVLKRRI